LAEAIKEGMLLWKPSEKFRNQSNMTDYIGWLKENRKLKINNYEELWTWSVQELETFWESLWDYFKIKASSPYLRVLSDRQMPGAKWFEGTKLNYGEHVFRNLRGNAPAIIAKSEIRPIQTITWQMFYDQVAAFAAGLREAGVRKGDRVVAYIPNIPEAAIAFVACASIGAIWSSCSPDFGSPTVIDRFKQIEPKILIAVDGYRYGGKDYERLSTVQEIANTIGTIEKTIILPYLSDKPNLPAGTNFVLWETFLEKEKTHELQFEQVPFDHPLWVLFSSGTTGLPKAIVQGHGGILLEHLKQGVLHLDLKKDDRLFWYTTTGWMMWNVVIGGLLAGSTILLYDGNPGFPHLDALWKFADDTEMTVFGTSASYLLNCMNSGLNPRKTNKLEKLKCIGSTGSPLPPEGFAWVYKHVKEDLWLTSVSGGTDVCSAFVGGAPILPVHAGEIQCRELGAKVEAFDEQGNSLIDRVGELVLTEPMPSMPLFFWNDPTGERYKSSYFDVYPGVWRHGDWIRISAKGSCQIYGRSDSTINRGGVRMGTSEIYRVVESVEGISDSLVIDLSNEKGTAFMPLFVVLENGYRLTDALENEMKERIRVHCSPRHVPDRIYTIKEVPRTLNGKKLEVPVKKILMGFSSEKTVNLGSLSNPSALDFFIKLADEISF
jgi:acetoacetyl-CoA synthetase